MKKLSEQELLSRENFFCFAVREEKIVFCDGVLFFLLSARARLSGEKLLSRGKFILLFGCLRNNLLSADEQR